MDICKQDQEAQVAINEAFSTPLSKNGGDRKSDGYSPSDSLDYAGGSSVNSHSVSLSRCRVYALSSGVCQWLPSSLHCPPRLRTSRSMKSMSALFAVSRGLRTFINSLYWWSVRVTVIVLPSVTFAFFLALSSVPAL